MPDDSFSPFQTPNTPKPDAQNQPGTTAMAIRPTAVTVFGILNLVFAGMGLFGLCCGIIPLLTMNSIQAMPNQPPNPVLELMKENQAYFVFIVVTMVLGLVATLVLACGGYGLLKMRPWGRHLSIVYAVYTILAGIVGLIANWFWLFTPLMEQARQASGPEQAGAIGGLVGGVCGGGIGLIYPVLLLIFMTRPNVVQAFRNQA